MPTYDIECSDCGCVFEHRCSFSDYDKHKDGTVKIPCESCGKTSTDIIITTMTDVNIRLATSEIKKLGHLAARNSEKFSDDYKHHLTEKHNAYRKPDPNRPRPELPRGMSRME